MAWSTPPTFVTGTTLTAANLNILSGDLSALGGAWTADVRSAASIWSGTLGSGGTIVSNYRQGGSGGVVDWIVEITLGTGFAIGTNLTIPVTMASAISPVSNDCFAWDASANAWWPVTAIPGSTSGLTLRTLPTTAGNNLVVISSTVPFSFAAGDVIAVKHSGRAA